MNRTHYTAEILDPGNDADAARLRDLLEGAHVRERCDTLDSQLRDWAKVLTPSQKLDDAGAERRVDELLGGRPRNRFGRWAFYPWSGRLVHVLPPAAFNEVRTNRNRNKLTATEQEQLGGITVGIVGLSVGNAVARTLALEAAAQCLKLADFDTLDLSNLNRLQAGVHELGLNKAVLAARQIAELNPYSRVIVFEDGISETNVDAFLAGTPQVQVLVDECDSLDIKLLLRERARERRIPVLMETSDRGLLDVERFDLEPDRPFFHGRVKDLDRRRLAGLSASDKVVPVLDIVGIESISARMGASLVEVGRSISTWPQLGGDVALGGATVAAAVRRIGLGRDLPSGRVHVDLEQCLNGLRDEPPPPKPEATPPQSRVPSPPSSFPSATLTSKSTDLHRFVVSHAILAPSGGNCQPWRFRRDGPALQIFHDRQRSANLLDTNHLASAIALGAAIENATIAAAASGMATDVELCPDPLNPEQVARLHFHPDTSEATRRLAWELDAVRSRATNRRNDPATPLSPEELAELGSAAESRSGHLGTVSTAPELAKLGLVLGEVDRLRFLCPEMHREMMSEVRWTRTEAERTRDGLELPTLELGAADLTALRLLARPDVVALIRKQGAGAALRETAIQAMRHTSAAGLIRFPEATFRGFLQAGRAVQRVWLTATRLGLAVQPMSPITFLSRLIQGPNRRLFTNEESGCLEEQAQRLNAMFTARSDWSAAFLVRFTRSSQVSARSMRRNVEDVFSEDN